AESRGCIASGSASAIEAQIVESVPMNPSAAYEILHPTDIRTGYIDLGPEFRLQVNSPVMQNGASSEELVASKILSIEESKGGSLNVDLKASPNLIGYEVAWYAIRPKPREAGYTVAPISAERHVNGQTERMA